MTAMLLPAARRGCSDDAADVKRTLDEAIASGDVEAATRLAALLAKRHVASANKTGQPADKSSALSDIPSSAAWLQCRLTYRDVTFVDVFSEVDASHEEAADQACRRLLDAFQALLKPQLDAQIEAVRLIVERSLQAVLSADDIVLRGDLSASNPRRISREALESNIAVRVDPLLHDPSQTAADVDRLLRQAHGRLYDDGLAKAAALLKTSGTRKPPPFPVTASSTHAADELANFLDEHILIGALSAEDRLSITAAAATVASKVAHRVREIDAAVLGGSTSSRVEARAAVDARRKLVMQHVARNRLALSDHAGTAENLFDGLKLVPASVRYVVGLHDDVQTELCRFLEDDRASNVATLSAKRAVEALNAAASRAASIACSDDEIVRNLVDDQALMPLASPVIPFGMLLRFRVAFGSRNTVDRLFQS